MNESSLHFGLLIVFFFQFTKKITLHLPPSTLEILPLHSHFGGDTGETKSSPEGVREIGVAAKKEDEIGRGKGGNERALSQGIQHRSPPSTNQLSTKAFLARH